MVPTMNLRSSCALGRAQVHVRKPSVASRHVCVAARMPGLPQASNSNPNVTSVAEASCLKPWALPVVAGTCATLLSLNAPASASVEPYLMSTIQPSHTVTQWAQTKQQHFVSNAAPPITSTAVLHQHQQQFGEQQPQQQPHELFQTATVSGHGPKVHWLWEVLGIGVVNIAGLWVVLKVLAWSKDTTTPVSVVRLHMGMRVEGRELQDKLHFIRSMMGVEHGMFFTLEETMQAVCQPPRGTQLAYADLSVTPLRSKHEGYDLFKKYAAIEVAAARQEEAGHVLHGNKPAPPKHRTPLQRIMGAAETQDVEESTSCVVVTVMLLARGTVSMPQSSIKDLTSFKRAMKQLCGGLRSNQLLAVELLMTPDNPADFLSEADLLLDHPNMIDLATGMRAADLRSDSDTEFGPVPAAGV